VRPPGCSGRTESEAEKEIALVKAVGSSSLAYLKYLKERCEDSMREVAVSRLSHQLAVVVAIVLSLGLVISALNGMVFYPLSRMLTEEARAETQTQTKELLSPTLHRIESDLDEAAQIREENRRWRLFLSSLPPAEQQKVLSKMKESAGRERQKTTVVAR
jgi:hypothetical protein